MNCIFAKTTVKLKKIIVILLLLAFSLRPAYYIGCLAYYGLNINTIIEQYCVNKNKPQLQCDGKCFLAQQLNQASDSNDTDANAFLSSLFESFMPVYISKQQDIKFSNFNTHAITYKTVFGYHDNYKFLFEFHNFKPPIYNI